MFVRILTLLSCLVTSPAAAVVVQDGDVYDRLEINDDLLMTGGSVNELVLNGGTTAVIEGGVLGEHREGGQAIYMTGDDHLTIRGGTIRRDDPFPSSDGFIRSQQGQPILTLEGTYFRMFDRGRSEENDWLIQGWLADGSFLNITFVHELLSAFVTIEFNFVPGEIPFSPGDTNYDDLVDLTDLNNVRNNFGFTGLGDTDQDGAVDLEDLNLIRNNFGRRGYFTLPPEFAVTQSGTVSFPPLPGSSFVPEPSAALLAISLIIALATYRGCRAL